MSKKTIRDFVREHRRDARVIPDAFKEAMQPVIDQALGSVVRQMIEGAAGKEVRVEIGEPCKHPRDRQWLVTPLDPAHTLTRLRAPGGAAYNDAAVTGWCEDCGALLADEIEVKRTPG